MSSSSQVENDQGAAAVDSDVTMTPVPLRRRIFARGAELGVTEQEIEFAFGDHCIPECANESRSEHSSTPGGISAEEWAEMPADAQARETWSKGILKELQFICDCFGGPAQWLHEDPIFQKVL